jgi:Putative phosphatase (DUF442)
VKIKKINDQLSVADQITKKDIVAISKGGFQSIICNRPDGEVPGQPAFKEIEEAASKANLPIRYLPAARACAAQLCGRLPMLKLWTEPLLFKQRPTLAMTSLPSLCNPTARQVIHLHVFSACNRNSNPLREVA